MNTATLTHTISNKNIIVITILSMLLHGIGLALLWQEPLLQFNEVPSHPIAIQLTAVTPQTTENTPSTQPESKQNTRPPAPPKQEEINHKPLKPSNLPPDTLIESTTPAKLQPAPVSVKSEENLPRPSSEKREENTANILSQTQEKTSDTSSTQASIAVKTFEAPLTSPRNALRLELHKHIVRTYPMMARKRGWEGKVLLGFDITSRGHIKNIHVIDSSGYAVLDKSAARALDKIKQLPLASTLLSQDIAMDLSIEYRLKDI